MIKALGHVMTYQILKNMYLLTLKAYLMGRGRKKERI